MCDFGNILDAYRLAHRGKSEAPEVVEFDKNRIYNLRKLQKKLAEKRWSEIFEYYNFIVSRPKRRSIDALTFEGRIVQHILCDRILRPWFERRLVVENAACRQGKGTTYATELLKKGMRKALRRGDCYVLKADVRKYFPSIDRWILKRLVDGFPDAEIREFLHFIIDNCPTDAGIPIGNQSSQWFALCYLDAADRIIKTREGVVAYVRYMDDLIVLAGKDTLIRLLGDLREHLRRERRLEFNSKTQISPLRDGVSFLGWRFVPHGMRVVVRVDGGKRKARIRKARGIVAAYHAGAKTFREFCDAVRSMVVNLSYGDTYRWRQRYGLKG